MFQIVNYVSPDGKDIYGDWIKHLRDTRSQIAIIRRIERLRQGNFGDHKSCGNGVWELRIDLGPGYRVYYGLAGEQVVLLLCGGDKATQNRDIDRAAEFWKAFRKETKNADKGS